MEILVVIFEVIGTIAFAVSGAVAAVERRMDVLGVVTLGAVTAVGGGILRDICLGNTPPAAFVNPQYTILAIAVSILVFLLLVRRKIQKTALLEKILMIMDSIGLGVFAMVGIHVAYTLNAGGFTMVMVGIFTGVGGGVIRDVFSKQIPYIFVKDFYCSAAIIGTVIATVLMFFVGEIPALVAGAAVIIVLRILASKFGWKLPKA